jgi:hypothetical protein
LIRRGVHKSVAALEKDIREWIKNWNEDPKPFVWKKTAEEIIDCQRTSGAGQYSSSTFGEWVASATVMTKAGLVLTSSSPVRPGVEMLGIG